MFLGSDQPLIYRMRKGSSWSQSPRGLQQRGGKKGQGEGEDVERMVELESQ